MSNDMSRIELDRALRVASAEGNRTEAAKLLNRGAKINNRDTSTKDGWSALGEAAFRGHLDVVDLLIFREADINIKNNSGSSALMGAACNGNFAVAELLLAKEADPNQQSQFGNTALIQAVRGHHRQTVELLLSKRADYSLRNNDSKSALNYACDLGYSDIVEMIESRAGQCHCWSTIYECIACTALMDFLDNDKGYY